MSAMSTKERSDWWKKQSYEWKEICLVAQKEVDKLKERLRNRKILGQGVLDENALLRVEIKTLKAENEKLKGDFVSKLSAINEGDFDSARAFLELKQESK